MMTSAFASMSEMATRSILNPFSSANSDNSTLSEVVTNSNSPSSHFYKNNEKNTEQQFDSSSSSSGSSSSSSTAPKLFRALSISKNKAASLLTSLPGSSFSTTFDSGDQSSPSSSSPSYLSASLTATATSVFNNLKSPFDSLNNINNTSQSTNNNSIEETNLNKNSSFNNKNRASLRQKQKQSLFSRFEYSSLSFTTAFGGANNINFESEEGVLEDIVEIELNDSNKCNISNSKVKMLESTSNRTNSESGLRGKANISKRKSKPAGTLEYEVKSGDTIEKIALKWNTVPSEIQHLNRLATRVIFPGQIIFVPDPNYVPPAPPASPPTSPPAIKSQSHNIKPEDHISPDYVIIEGPVAEQQSNQPQQQQSQTGFGGLFKWKTNSNPKPGHIEQQTTPEVAKTSVERRGSLSRHTLTEEEAKQLDEECMQRFLKVNCKIVTRSKGCYDGVLIITPSAVMFDPLDTSSNNTTALNEKALKYSGAGNAAFSGIYDEASAIIPIEVISNVIMYEDLALKDVQEYFDYQSHQEQLDSDSGGEKTDASFNLSNDLSPTEETSPLDNSITNNNETIKKLVSVTTAGLEKPKDTDEVFVEAPKNSPDLNSGSKEKLSSSSSLSSSSATISCYLCIKVNTNKDFIVCPLNRKMKNRLKSEFWFQINDNSTDKICAFFLEWKNDPTYALTHETMPKGRFQLVKHDEKLDDLISDHISEDVKKSFSGTNRLVHRVGTFVKDWEIVNLQELQLKIKQEIEIEKEYKTLPTLMNPSTILKEEHLRKLNVNLIPRAVGYNWMLSFSTELHGFSLGTMYRNLSEVDGPCLVVVMDTNRNIFGAMTSSKLYPSEHFYGTGESFLFTFYPSFKVFKWTGENNFFTRGTTESIGFGCGDGSNGLRFDSDLLNGQTKKSKTYDNEMLTSSEYFTIASIEVWTFAD